MQKIIVATLLSQSAVKTGGGARQSAAADGTHFETYEDNLLAEHHIRYGKTGGIAYPTDLKPESMPTRSNLPQ